MGAHNFTTAMDVLVPALDLQGLVKDGDRWVLDETHPSIHKVTNVCIAATLAMAENPQWTGNQVTEWMRTPNTGLDGVTPADFALAGDKIDVSQLKNAAQLSKLAA